MTLGGLVQGTRRQHRDGAADDAERPGGRRRSLTPRRAGLVETIAIGLLPVAWLWATISVLGESWLWPVVFAVGTMALASALVRAIAPSLLGTIAAAVVGAGWLTALAAADEAAFGVVPTPDSVVATMQTLNRGAIDIAWALSTPMVVTADVLVAIVAAAVALTLLIDVLAHVLRVPAIAILIAAVPLVLPIAFRIDVPWWHAMPGVIATALVLVAPAIDERLAIGRGWLAPLALVGAVAVLAAAVPLVAPNPREADFELPTLDELITPATPILNTEIDLGDQLRRPADRPVFTYSTTDGEPILTRLMSLPEAGESGFVSVAPVPGSPNVLVEGADLAEPLQMTVRMGNVRAESLPTPERVVRVPRTEGTSWDDANDALRISADVDTNALEYTATGSRSLPLEALPADAASTGHDAYLAMPEEAAAIAAVGADLVDDSMSATARVQAVHAYMTDGLWNYSEQLDLPGFGGSAGDGWAALEGFLENRSGYCVHYASATAGLLRGAGVPARVVVGFLPGDAIAGGWAVSTNEMHAWAEAWIDGAGWVRVETTPGAGTGAASPSGGEVTQSPTPEPQETEDPAEPTPSPTPTAAPTAPAPTGSAAPGEPGSDEAPALIDPALLRTILLVLGVLLVLAMPAIVRALQRVVRLRRGPTGGWAELRATLADLGQPLPASATPGLVQGAIAARVDAAPAAASDRVRLAAERAVFDAGPRDRGTVDGDVREVRRALARSAPWWRRALAAVLPPSLVRVIAQDGDR